MLIELPCPKRQKCLVSTPLTMQRNGLKIWPIFFRELNSITVIKNWNLIGFTPFRVLRRTEQSGFPPFGVFWLEQIKINNKIISVSWMGAWNFLLLSVNFFYEEIWLFVPILSIYFLKKTKSLRRFKCMFHDQLSEYFEFFLNFNTCLRKTTLCSHRENE